MIRKNVSNPSGGFTHDLESKMSTFIIPTEGNSITPNDIVKKSLRITKELKKYFPSFNCELVVLIDDIPGTVKLYNKDSADKERSYVLKFNKNDFNRLSLTTKDKIKVTKIEKCKFEFEKIKN
jgi:hypothetical protein